MVAQPTSLKVEGRLTTVLCLLVTAFGLACGTDSPYYQEFMSVLQASKGVYKDPAKAARYENTLLVASVNYAYVDFALNWVCTAESLGLKYVIAAQDEPCAIAMKQMGVPVIEGPKLGIVSGTDAASWDAGFMRIVHNKVRSVINILEAGYNVIFSDVDIVFLSDPVPHFAGDADLEFQWAHSRAWNRAPLAGETEVYTMINTGFYMVKPTPPGLEFMRALEQALIDDPTTGSDKAGTELLRAWVPAGKVAYFHESVASVPSGPEVADKLKLRILNPMKFPQGYSFFLDEGRPTYEAALKQRGMEGPVAVHATFMMGRHTKVDALTAKGLWNKECIEERNALRRHSASKRRLRA